MQGAAASFEHQHRRVGGARDVDHDEVEPGHDDHAVLVPEATLAPVAIVRSSIVQTPRGRPIDPKLECSPPASGRQM